MTLADLAAARWDFRDARGRSPWRRARVPGCVHSDLLRHGLIPDPFRGTNELSLQWIEERDWEYRCRFSAPSGLLDHAAVELVSEGLDTIAEVALNGHLVARTDNMFTGFRREVGRLLRPGPNELRIRLASALRQIRATRTGFTPPREFNDPVGNSARIRKQPCQFGWDWGPRLVTAGVWRGLRLEGWDGNRLAQVRVSQRHRGRERVRVAVAPELARRAGAEKLFCHAEISFAGKVLAQDRAPVRPLRPGMPAARLELAVAHPRLWWPNGQGEAALHTLVVRLTDAAGRELDRWSRRLGLRTVALERRPDRWGESFRFVVNGRPIFAKGANWIPAHSFVAGLERRDYERDLRSAAAAHMNMLRVWGGGIYESDDFYDLCDELGLLVWQDFMFACTLYPSDRAFLASVRTEASQQVRRLRHHACLALWCGNNEIAQLQPKELAVPRWRIGYRKLFHRLLPGVVRAEDPGTAYWPSSPWRGRFDRSRAGGEKRGDTHFWDVWHARHPVKDYEKWAFRFVSEFGMQSYASSETNARFCPPGEANVFGPAMENHQKNRAGNQIILDYVSRRYRFPKDQEALLYLSQLNQAFCIQTGVEHYRRLRPRCMGALYWQLNDCWPGASWSSLEFGGRWKALHHLARRFFAPVLATARVPGDETVTIGNYRRSTVRTAELYTVSDAPADARGELRWDLFEVGGKGPLLSGRKRVVLRRGESVLQRRLDLGRWIERRGRDRLYLRLALRIGRKTVGEDTVFLAPPRFLDLPRGRTAVAVQAAGPARFQLSFTSPVFQHRFAFDLSGLAHAASDNYFELYPGESKTVTVELDRPLAAARLRKRIRFRSLVDSYD